MLRRSPEIDRARFFADVAHSATGQVRKYTGEPYKVHCIAVARLVQSIPHDSAMICAALLHDVIEDTAITPLHLAAEFGDDVAMLVRWLTDTSRPADGNRVARKAIDRDRLAAAPLRAQQIKLADLIDNAGSIVAHDPKFSRVFMAEFRQLVDVLSARGPLMDRARDILDGYYEGVQ